MKLVNGKWKRMSWDQAIEALKRAIAIEGTPYEIKLAEYYPDWKLASGAAAGARAILAPGGSIRDEEVAAAARELGITLIRAERRPFNH